MKVELDSDVQKLAVFMQANFETSKLVSLSGAISRLAPVIWGHYRRDELAPMMAIGDPPECKPETSIR
jgi:hypothetical protein